MKEVVTESVPMKVILGPQSISSPFSASCSLKGLKSLPHAPVTVETKDVPGNLK